MKEREEHVFAVVGCGSIGKRHIRNLRLLGERRIIGVEVNPDRCAEVERDLGVVAVAAMDEALARGANVVFVSLPTVYHLEVLRQAVAADCHIFVEKPLSHSSDGVAEHIQESERRKLVGFVASNFKFHVGFRLMKDLLDSGRIGRVLAARAVCGQYLPDWHPWEDYRLSYSARRCLGGGVLLDSHELMYMTWFLGRTRIVACMLDRLSDLEIDTEDTASLLLKMESGAQVQLHLDYTQRAYQRRYELYGAEGTLLWDARERCVKIFEAGGTCAVFDEPAGYDLNQMYVEQTRHFLQCLSGESRPLTTLSEGLYAIRLAEAARQSSVTETFVEVSS